MFVEEEEENKPPRVGPESEMEVIRLVWPLKIVKGRSKSKEISSSSLLWLLSCVCSTTESVRSISFFSGL